MRFLLTNHRQPVSSSKIAHALRRTCAGCTLNPTPTAVLLLHYYIHMQHALHVLGVTDHPHAWCIEIIKLQYLGAWHGGIW